MLRKSCLGKLLGICIASVMLIDASIVLAACPGGTCHVDDDCSPPTDGTSGDPDCTIQEGINRASNGETVLVRSGSYGPIVFNNRAITVRRETDTILPTITDTGGTTKVQFINGDTSVLDGFGITGSSSRGIVSTASSPTIKNCTIWNNQTDGINGGAGILLSNSNAQIIDCIIGPDNQAIFGSGNSNSGQGGGISIVNGTPQITGCTIQDNTAAGSLGNGGGIAIKNGYPVITNCIVSGNTASGNIGGGGVWISSPPFLEEETTSAASCEGGCPGSAYTVKLRNCLITGNAASGTTAKGGGLYVSSDDTEGTTEISNCTISDNSATGDGSGIFGFANRCITLRNSILWDNGSGGLGSEITLEQGMRVFLRYDDIEGGLSNIKLSTTSLYCLETQCDSSQILNSDPNFCNGYHLCRVSPCIDSGDNGAVPSGITLDLDGNTRFVDDLCTSNTGCGTAPIVDMGAYEYQVMEAEILDWKSVVTHGTSNVIGLLVPDDASFSESRNGGVTKLRISFSSPIDPDSVSSSNVTVCGNDVEDEPLDLSGITVTTSVLSGDMVVDINFSPKLPNYARYFVRIDEVLDVDCNEITTNNERIFTSMFGDYTGDRRVNATDLGGVRYLEGTGPPINPNAPNGTQQVRADVDNDDDVDEDDSDLVSGEVGKDAREISTPSCSEEP